MLQGPFATATSSILHSRARGLGGSDALEIVGFEELLEFSESLSPNLSPMTVLIAGQSTTGADVWQPISAGNCAGVAGQGE